MTDINALRAQLTSLPDDLDKLEHSELVRIMEDDFEVLLKAEKRKAELLAELKRRGEL